MILPLRNDLPEINFVTRSLRDEGTQREKIHVRSTHFVESKGALRLRSNLNIARVTTTSLVDYR